MVLVVKNLPAEAGDARDLGLRSQRVGHNWSDLAHTQTTKYLEENARRFQSLGSSNDQVNKTSQAPQNNLTIKEKNGCDWKSLKVNISARFNIVNACASASQTGRYNPYTFSWMRKTPHCSISSLYISCGHRQHPTKGPGARRGLWPGELSSVHTASLK